MNLKKSHAEVGPNDHWDHFTTLEIIVNHKYSHFDRQNTNKNIIKDELKVKRKNAFRELLKESNVNVTSNWKEIRRKIKDDVRYQKYRHSLPLKLITNHLKLCLLPLV